MQWFTGSNPSDQPSDRQDKTILVNMYDSDSAVVSWVVLFDIDYDVCEGNQFMKMKM